MISWICPFCNKELQFEKHQQKGAHHRNCEMNPKKVEISKRIAIINTLPRITIMKNCLKCGTTFTQHKTQSQINRNRKKDIRLYCSESCAKSHVVSDAHKQKVSATLKEKYQTGELQPINPRKRESRSCIICDTEFECVPSSKKVVCGRKCVGQVVSLKLKGTGKIGGYKIKSGTSKFHGSYYNEVWMDSSWEVELAKRLDILGIEWERDNTYFHYIDIDGNKRKYYPDFYIPKLHLYIEVKGYWTDRISHKIQNVVANNSFQLIILDSMDAIRSFIL